MAYIIDTTAPAFKQLCASVTSVLNCAGNDAISVPALGLVYEGLAALPQDAPSSQLQIDGSSAVLALARKILEAMAIADRGTAIMVLGFVKDANAGVYDFVSAHGAEGVAAMKKTNATGGEA